MKTNKTSTKELKIKIINKNNKDWGWNTNNKEVQAVIFSEGDEKKENTKKDLQVTN